MCFTRSGLSPVRNVSWNKEGFGGGTTIVESRVERESDERETNVFLLIFSSRW